MKYIAKIITSMMLSQKYINRRIKRTLKLLSPFKADCKANNDPKRGKYPFPGNLKNLFKSDFIVSLFILLSSVNFVLLSIEGAIEISFPNTAIAIRVIVIMLTLIQMFIGLTLVMNGKPKNKKSIRNKGAG
jgi:hypothetical protein